MSRIGKTPITVPSDVTVTAAGSRVIVKGPKGELVLTLPAQVGLKNIGGCLEIVNQSQDRRSRALHGFVRAQLANHIKGVTVGWTKTLEMAGVGYRASLSGSDLVLTVGFSHPVKIVPPPGITFALNEGKIVVAGVDKQMVGQIAAEIRSVKKPEPYKGKGIRYQGEHIRKKAGKSAKAIGGAPGATK